MDTSNSAVQKAPKGTTSRNREAQKGRRIGLKAPRPTTCKSHSQIPVDEVDNMHAFHQTEACPNTSCSPLLHQSSHRTQSSNEHHNFHIAFTQGTLLDPRLKAIDSKGRAVHGNEFSTTTATALTPPSFNAALYHFRLTLGEQYDCSAP